MGTSSGAAFGAALYFVLGALWKFETGPWLLPLAASAGAFLATGLVLVLSQNSRNGRGSIITLLLMGIAINAIFLSGVGFLSYIARDPQARSITFWNMGTLSGSLWPAVLVTCLTTIVCLMMALLYAKQLNALMMGEDEAMLIGVNVRRLKRNVLFVNVIMIASVTAFTGVISFVGLLVPHLLRIWKGSDNRYLLLGSALSGGILLSGADILARLLLRPSELPIGIVTSIIGVPAFIFLLRKNKYFF
jgi:iron complex transport system permease protein